MKPAAGDGLDIVHDDCINLRQGDVLDIERLVLGGVVDVVASIDTSNGIAVLSQTCDVIQRNKTRCLVAPIVTADAAALNDARKGRKPLHLYLGDVPDLADPCVADIEQATSVPKTQLVGRRILRRYTHGASADGVAQIATRIGRAFTRFPFPDEIYPVFTKLRARAQKQKGHLGSVLDRVLDIRVSADQWTGPSRRLTLWIVVPEQLISPVEDLDPSWQWESARVAGLDKNEELNSLPLRRVCELIATAATDNPDLTTLSKLWMVFGDRFRAELLDPTLAKDETDGPAVETVTEIDVQVLSEIEFTYQQYRSTESLDLEALSLTVTT